MQPRAVVADPVLVTSQRDHLAWWTRPSIMAPKRASRRNHARAAAHLGPEFHTETIYSSAPRQFLRLFSINRAAYASIG